MGASASAPPSIPTADVTTFLGVSASATAPGGASGASGASKASGASGAPSSSGSAKPSGAVSIGFSLNMLVVLGGLLAGGAFVL